MARRAKPRRGVLLLIVLSLLVLFLLVGLSFIVSASQFKRLSDQDAKTDLTGMPGEKLANAAVYQILRGTNNEHSKVRRHSLLEDTYGRDYFKGTAVSVADYESDNNNRHQTQVIQFDFSSSEFTSEGNSVPVTKLDDYFGGCVLTYVSGNAKGRSTRVVKFDLSPPASFTQPIIITLGVRDDLSDPPMAGSRFIINGRPMNGVGAGFNPNSGKLDATLTLESPPFPFDVPAAFAPNYSVHNQVFDYGGLDEPWDNVDYQNMFLAHPANPNVSPSDNAFVQQTAGAIPSFHRPFLYAHLREKYESIWENAALRNAFVLRPSTLDHPGFTGSNPDFDPIDGPWDVDNDGDGIPDSVWIDFGLSPVTGPDGRLYKPLIAPMLLPLDGRLNANAADSLQRLTIDYDTNSYVQFPNAVAPPTASVSTQNAFGAGFGTADVALTGPQGKLENNFPAKQVAQRYVPADGSVTEVDSRPGKEQIDDHLEMKAQGIGEFLASNNYVNEIGLLTGYGSPADLFGRGLPFIDTTGNMLWRHPMSVAGGTLVSNDSMDDPYEVDPYQKSATDGLFTLTELEAKLRRDADTSLLGPTRNVPIALPKTTTLSSYIPAPVTINSGRFRHNGSSGDGLRRSIRDIIAARIRRVARVATPPLAVSETDAFTSAEAFVPEELIRGEKLDLNRALRPNTPQHTIPQSNRILREKQLFARDLYHMMMLVTEFDFGLPPSSNSVEPLNPLQRRRLFARRVAQWAINVVDFGDADSVMTPFVYDPTPFNLSDNAAIPSPVNPVRSQYPLTLPPAVDVVWGCEHPELLLTETLAFHDRRVKDLAVDKKRKNDKTGEVDDDDLDQPVPPQGSLFIELYCPRAVQSQQVQGLSLPGSVAGLLLPTADLASRPPEDLYNGVALDLAKVPAGSTKPTWRIAISERHLRSDDNAVDNEKSALEARRTFPDVASFEPDDFDLRVVGENQDLKDLTLERFIWFSVNPPGESDQEKARNTYYAHPEANGNFTQPVDPVVNPGDYVVVGPRQLTPLGLKSNDATYTQSSGQQIDLTNTHLGSLSGLPRRGSKPGRVVPIIAQTANKVGCSISEPTDTTHYYERLGAGTTKYDNARDTPFDEEDPDDASPIPEIEQRPLWEPLPDPDADTDDSAYTLASGTRENIRTVFLQRLANPNQPWDPIRNPYRTIDWMPVDLTVFNSLDEETSNNAPDGAPFDPRDPKDVEVLGANERWEHQDTVTKTWSETEFNFGSREKAGPGLNIWSAESVAISTTRWKPAAGLPNRPHIQLPDQKNKAASIGIVGSLSDHPAYHTLGWLNRSWDTIGLSFDGDGHFRVDADYGEAPVGYRDYDEANPLTSTNLWTSFPTLVWNNRPYANEYEVMLVPASSQARLTHEYTVSQPTSPIVDSNLFAGHYGAFRHLLNFFHSTLGVPEEAVPFAPNYFRIFDYVNVPSRFQRTRDWFNTSQLTADSPFLRDPSYSKFREPGRICMNTAAADSVFMDMGMDGLPANTTVSPNPPENKFFNATDFEQTLAGRIPRPNGPTGGAPNSVDVRFPTGAFPAMYPNPLRAAAAAALLPEMPPLTIPPTLAVDATLLRSSSVTNRQPALAKYKEQLITGDLVPQQIGQGLSQFGQAFQNRKTNAFFRYRDIQKVGASASAQTNVFAVWVTVGYFEIEPNYKKSGAANYDLTNPFVVDPLHPDGYTLGAEMGSELGNVNRHRSFFIIDRSIPVAFEPGVNHNVDDAILLRRNLE